MATSENIPDISDWNFSQKYADLWKEDEEKLLICAYNKDFSGLGNLLLMIATKYPEWALLKYDALQEFDKYSEEVLRHIRLKNRDISGDVTQEEALYDSERKLMRRFAEKRLRFARSLDSANLLLLKRKFFDEDNTTHLIQEYKEKR